MRRGIPQAQEGGSAAEQPKWMTNIQPRISFHHPTNTWSCQRDFYYPHFRQQKLTSSFSTHWNKTRRKAKSCFRSGLKRLVQKYGITGTRFAFRSRKDSLRISADLELHVNQLKRLLTWPLQTCECDKVLASGPARLTWGWPFRSDHIFAETGSQGREVL